MDTPIILAALPAPAPAQPDLNSLPVNVTRREGSSLLARYFYPVSARTLERWPVPTRNVGGRVVMSTAALFAVARERMEGAPVIMGGVTKVAA